MDIKDAVTLVLATVGAVLGVFNAWRNFQMDRVRLRVRWVQPFHLPSRRRLNGVEVVNLSNFPVTVEEIGFFGSPDVALGPKHITILEPVFLCGKVSLPVRLEPRAAFTGCSSLITDDKVTAQGWVSYARTACGATAWSKAGEVH
jgi:hypothetical protein